MMPNGITLLFKEARDTFPPIKGNPSDNNLLLVRKTLLPILMEIPSNQLGRTHSLTAILMDPTRYAADHGGTTFVCPICLPLYNNSIADDATAVICIHTELSHQACQWRL